MSDQVLNMLNAKAERIRSAVPIVGATATDAEVVARSEHATAVLGNLLATEADTHRRWYTCRLADGRIAGRWANSAAEAVLYVAVWTGVPVVRCVLDPDGALHSADREAKYEGLFDMLDLADHESGNSGSRP